MSAPEIACSARGRARISALTKSAGTAGIAIVALSILLNACSPTVDNVGNIPLQEIVERVEPGKTTRDEVENMLGSPSTQAIFEKNHIWYYIGKRTERIAFLDPTVIKSQVLEIRFDQRGVVSEVKRHDTTQTEAVELVDRVTPTKGQELTFIEQIIGNIGRFGKAGAAGGDE